MIDRRQLAKVLHDATSLIPRGDGSTPLPWVSLSVTQQELAVAAVEKVMSTPFHTINEERGSEMLHDLWATGMAYDGWRYGENYDIVEKTHPDLVPYNTLPDYVQDKDRIWWHLTEIMKAHD
jgi:hypothetical protein